MGFYQLLYYSAFARLALTEIVRISFNIKIIFGVECNTRSNISIGLLSDNDNSILIFSSKCGSPDIGAIDMNIAAIIISGYGILSNIFILVFRIFKFICYSTIITRVASSRNVALLI